MPVSHPLSQLWAVLSFQLTSFSPHMWLTVEPEAGLEAGPITETTPLGKIWHTERQKRRNTHTHTHEFVKMHTASFMASSRTRGMVKTIQMQQNIRLKWSHWRYKNKKNPTIVSSIEVLFGITGIVDWPHTPVIHMPFFAQCPNNSACVQDVGTNVLYATVYLLIFHWSSICFLSSCHTLYKGYRP